MTKKSTTVGDDTPATIQATASNDCCPYCGAQLQERLKSRNGYQRYFECPTPTCGRGSRSEASPRFRRYIDSRQPMAATRAG